MDELPGHSAFMPRQEIGLAEETDGVSRFYMTSRRCVPVISSNFLPFTRAHILQVRGIQCSHDGHDVVLWSMQGVVYGKRSCTLRGTARCRASHRGYPLLVLNMAAFSCSSCKILPPTRFGRLPNKKQRSVCAGPEHTHLANRLTWAQLLT